MANSTAAHKAYQQLEQRFVARNPSSKAVYAQATASLPGGNTRTVLYYSPFPLCMTSAEGSRLHSADGDTYIDLLGEYTAGLYGHSEPRILDAITAAARRGLNFGSQHADEAKLAGLVQARFPGMQLVRFTNSGTEATLMALAAAQVYTRRRGGGGGKEKKKVLVFDGAYHGAVFMFAGGKPSSTTAPYEYLIAKYNDLNSVYNLLRDPSNAATGVAAILVEAGMLGSGGAIPAQRSFLEGLRNAANESGAVLIFDEVMTSRLHGGGGAQSQLPADMWPDLTTLGKYIGGGMSFGAFGGKREIMELFDPRRPDAIAHAGTFNNNVMTMSAGIAGLTQVFTPHRAQQLHCLGERLRSRLNETAHGTLMKVTGCGSIMCFHFTQTPVDNIRAPADFADEDASLHGLLHLFMLERGYHLARRGFIALNLALSEEELDGFVQAVVEFVQEYRQVLGGPTTWSKS